MGTGGSQRPVAWSLLPPVELEQLYLQTSQLVSSPWPEPEPRSPGIYRRMPW